MTALRCSSAAQVLNECPIGGWQRHARQRQRQHVFQFQCNTVSTSNLLGFTCVHGQCRPPQCTFVAKMKSDSSEQQSRTESEWPQIASGHKHTHTHKQTETRTEAKSSKKALQQAGTACRALSTDSVTGFDHQVAAAAAAAAVDVVISHCFLCVHTCATSVKVRER